MLHHDFAESFVKENGRIISRLLRPVSKFRQARYSSIPGKVEGEKLVPVIGLRKSHAGSPILTEHGVQECVVLQIIPPS